MKAYTTGALSAMVLAAIGAVILVVCRSSAVEAAYPVERGRLVFAQKIASRISGLFRAAEASAENVKLKREVALLTLERSELEKLENENARLRRALGYKAAKENRYIAAAVLSRGGGCAGSEDVLRVDKGSLAGVAQGAIVTVPEGLVGRVVSTTLHTSEVRLLTDPRLKVACEVESMDGVKMRGIITGGARDILLMKYLTDVREVPVRSRVLTSGLGGVFPRGIDIGTLLVVTNKMSEVTGEVSPTVDFSTLEDVFIRCEK